MATRSRNATEAVLALARQRPELGVVRAARELRKRGVRLSPSGVREIWARHNLGTSYERLLSRRRGGNGEDAALSESQRSLLQRMRVSRRLIQQAGAEAAASGRREQLISAAARVIGAKGYERASLQEICAAAGILPGSLYYHFKSKEDLFIKVHAEGFRQLNEAVDRAVAAESDPGGASRPRAPRTSSCWWRATTCRWSPAPACSTWPSRRCSAASTATASPTRSAFAP